MAGRIGWRKAVRAGCAAALLIACHPNFASVHYRLVHESKLTEECAGCEQPTSSYTLKGELDISRFGSPLGTNFRLDNIDCSTVDRPGAQYHITGSGTFDYSNGSPFPSWAYSQFSLHVDDGVTNRLIFFYRRTLGGGFFPWDVVYRFSSVQFDTNQSPNLSFLFTCAPVQEIWLTTQRGLTSTQPSIGTVGPGDILSDSGAVVRRATELLRPFGVEPGAAAEAEVDALGVATGGELVFSLKTDLVNAAGVRLRHGDLLSAKGSVYRSNAQLLRNFGVVLTNEDFGLDGIEISQAGAVLFSITTNVYSEKLGQTLTAGDILSEDGLVIRAEKDLLTYLRRDTNDGPFGVAGFHFLSPTETWFCTEKGFQSVAGPVAAGDILSTSGYVVFRSSELLAKFKPIGDDSDVGVAGLFVIGPRDASSPAFAWPYLSLSAAGVGLSWATTARVSQLQGAENGNGPYLPLSPIMTEMKWFDPRPPSPGSARFYRLQVW